MVVRSHSYVNAAHVRATKEVSLCSFPRGCRNSSVERVVSETVIVRYTLIPVGVGRDSSLIPRRISLKTTLTAELELQTRNLRRIRSSAKLKGFLKEQFT